MSHKWWHPFKSDEEKRLEVINDEIEQHERMIAKDKSGAVLEALKGPLEKLQKEKAELKVKNPDSKFIQENLVSNPDPDGGIFSGGAGENLLNSIKGAATNAALEKVGVPGAINYDTIGSVTDSFKQGGAGEAADTIINIAKDRGVEAALQYATGIGLHLQVASQILNSSFLAPVTGPFKKDANTMFSNLTFGQGPKLYDAITDPFNFFGGTSGILNNQQNVVRDEKTTDDIQIQPLPVQINRPTMADVSGPSSSNRPTMADVSGPSSSNGTSSYSPQDRNIQPARAPAQPENNPYSRFGRFGRANGGLVSMARVLKR